MGNTLQATALVNEAYLRMVDVTGVRWRDRAHFFAVSSQVMRRILVHAVQARRSGKRGGGVQRLNLNESIDAMPAWDNFVVDLDDALKALEEFDQRKAKVAEIRFFGGRSVEEPAEALNISLQSLMRDWKLSRASLTRELSRYGSGSRRSEFQSVRAPSTGRDAPSMRFGARSTAAPTPARNGLLPRLDERVSGS